MVELSFRSSSCCGLEGTARSLPRVWTLLRRLCVTVGGGRLSSPFGKDFGQTALARLAELLCENQRVIIHVRVHTELCTHVYSCM